MSHLTPDMIPDDYAVVGNPIAHSKSPDIHAAFAAQTDQAIRYVKKLIDIGQFKADVDAFFRSGGKGLNVTLPFKENAFEYADVLTPRAQYAGAVNTLAKQSDGKILGDNTDGAGMMADIARQGWTVKGRSVLVLGAGGAVRGVLLPLLEAEPSQVVVANRTLAKAQTLVDMFSDRGSICAQGFEQLEGSQFDLIINGTSAGLTGAMPALPAGLFSPGGQAYDMMYSAEPTGFQQWAADQGIGAIANGLGMLVGQAAESFFVWRGMYPDVEPVLNALRKELIA